MDEASERPKLHAVCMPFPTQGHINPMLTLAKLLHSQGIFITFVHSQFNYHRLLPSLPRPLPSGFQIQTIPDGLSPDNPRGILNLPDLCRSLPVHGMRAFRELVARLNSNASEDCPPVSWIVSDGVMSFTLEVAKEFDIPEVIFFTPSACGFLGYLQFEELVERGYFPLKDESCLSNGYLDTVIDWIPAMKGIRLKDLPSFIRTTNPNDTMFHYNVEQVKQSTRARALILNTFDELEQEVLEAIKEKFPKLHTVGPLSLLQRQVIFKNPICHLESSLWEKDVECLDWLNSKEPRSVVYVNFGSLATMSADHLQEFACGLVRSERPFLWVIRPDLVKAGGQISSQEYLDAISENGMLVGWCPQEKVLEHPSIGCFVTHCGWNSTLESISEGVPLLCWPHFAEQQTNCFYASIKWGIGIEIGDVVTRDKVEFAVKEMMEGDKGKEATRRCKELKEKAEAATRTGGSSHTNFMKLLELLKTIGSKNGGVRSNN